MTDDIPVAINSLRTDERLLAYAKAGSARQAPLPMLVLTVPAGGGYGDASVHTMRRAMRDMTEVMLGQCSYHTLEAQPAELARAILGVVGP